MAEEYFELRASDPRFGPLSNYPVPLAMNKGQGLDGWNPRAVSQGRGIALSRPVPGTEL